MNPKETPMQYKTMILELLSDRPQMHEQLRKERKLLATMERYAQELKASHQAWTEMLTQMRPGSSQAQLTSEALEIALKELEDHLPSESPWDTSPSQFLDAAMLFVRPRTPRG
jgi:hypothetical protein